MPIDDTASPDPATLIKGIESLQQQIAGKNKSISSMSRTISGLQTQLNQSQQAERETTRDRDRWRARARSLEARLKSHGIDPDGA